jgi:hypothetical protein
VENVAIWAKTKESLDFLSHLGLPPEEGGEDQGFGHVGRNGSNSEIVNPQAKVKTHLPPLAG